MKGLRGIFTRYDKHEELYIGFTIFGPICDALRSVNQALVPRGLIVISFPYIKNRNW